MNDDSNPNPNRAALACQSLAILRAEMPLAIREIELCRERHSGRDLLVLQYRLDSEKASAQGATSQILAFLEKATATVRDELGDAPTCVPAPLPTTPALNP